LRRDVVDARRIGAHRVKRRRHLLPVDKRRRRNRAGAKVAALDFVDVDDAGGVGERKPLQQHAVDDAEHRGVGANADRQRENDDRGEHRGLEQHAHRMPQVTTQFIHVAGHQSSIAANWSAFS